MTIQLFELCGADRNIRFSPFVWRARLALCQKGLPFQGIPGNYREKDQFAPSGSTTFPVIKDGDTWVADSWAIAEYLEDQYPDRPSLFGSPEGKSFSLFIQHYFASQIQIRIFHLIAPEIAGLLEPPDRDYFVETRSKRIGMPLAELIPLREKNLGLLKSAMTPLRDMLGARDFLSGPRPLYPDFIGFAAFKWARLSSPLDLLEGEDVLTPWLKRVEGFYQEKIRGLEAKPLL